MILHPEDTVTGKDMLPEGLERDLLSTLQDRIGFQFKPVAGLGAVNSELPPF
ncbi:MAG: hypothetical protein LUD15_03100 [Bacteroides sp.]|nr:hypothetical protein [Bacteroides sp.]